MLSIAELAQLRRTDKLAFAKAILDPRTKEIDWEVYKAVREYAGDVLEIPTATLVTVGGEKHMRGVSGNRHVMAKARAV